MATDKMYYTISEIAEMFNVNQSLIRFWETEFPRFIKPKRNKRGVRFYTPNDIENIRKILYLVKDKKYTLKGAKAALKDPDEIIPEEVPEVKPGPSQDEIILLDNHRKVYNKLLEIRKIAQGLLGE
ncbi:MAG: MerR family transcriptional regulator [Bacteroidales bacterium]|jgi:DNA-binding transcriptional MerR regulator|nr:MerR family transcriptional regulator [Bacteroidales bacterium]